MLNKSQCVFFLFVFFFFPTSCKICHLVWNSKFFNGVLVKMLADCIEIKAHNKRANAYSTTAHLLFCLNIGWQRTLCSLCVTVASLFMLTDIRVMMSYCSTMQFFITTNILLQCVINMWVCVYSAMLGTSASWFTQSQTASNAALYVQMQRGFITSQYNSLPKKKVSWGSFRNPVGWRSFSLIKLYN